MKCPIIEHPSLVVLMTCNHQNIDQLEGCMEKMVTRPLAFAKMQSFESEFVVRVVGCNLLKFNLKGHPSFVL